MKKSGFTLAEIIVTLTIIGIIAALIAPKINVLIPDKNKVKIIKYYNLINDGIESMLGDTDLYHPSWQAVNINNEDVEIFTANGTDPCVGLQCIEQLNPSDEQSYITRQLRDKLGLNNDNIAADGSTITMTDFDSTSEEMTVTIRTAPGKGNCQSRVLTIQPPNNISPCETLKQVDTFTFKIDKYGTISPTDVLTKIYLKNATDMNNRRTDFNEANTLIASLNEEANFENAKNRAKESRSKAKEYLTENEKKMSEENQKKLNNLLNDLDKMLDDDNATSDAINNLSNKLEDMLEGLKNNIDTQSVLDDTKKFIEEYRGRAPEDLLNTLKSLNDTLDETQNKKDASSDEIKNIINQINELKNQIETEAEPDIAKPVF